MLVKISNLRDPSDIDTIASLTPTYMGFNFCHLSPHYIGEIDASLFSNIPAKVRKTGRFENQHTLQIISLAGRYSLNTIQLDGNESPSQCERLSAEGLEVIKTITEQQLDQTEQYEGVCNRFVFRVGSTDKISTLYHGKTPFLIETNNLTFTHPMLCGVDTATLFEIDVARKDIAQVTQFIKKYSML